MRLTWVPPHSSTDQPMRVAAVDIAHGDNANLVTVFLPNSARALERIASTNANQPSNT